MFRSLYGKLALVLMAVFVAVGALMILASQQMIEAQRLLELATTLIIGAVAFSLVAALIVFRFLTRRLRTLAEAIDAFRTEGFARPMHVPAAEHSGDEIDRISGAFQEMSARIASQLQELAQVDRRRRELLANVSHDLRTPLASMQGYLETLLIKEGSLPPAEARAYLQVAARHCERLGRLVSDLFELTKLEAREVQPQPELFQIAELIQDVAQKFELRAQGQGVRLVTAFAMASPSVAADIGMTERVLENLIENALRHTPSGGEIRIGARPEGARVELRVADTGEGIAPEELPNIFDRYYQVDRSASGSAGLGLAITRRIVELHGGRIAAQSTPGRGSTFVFDLPAAGTALPGGTTPTATAEADAAGARETIRADRAIASLKGRIEAQQADLERALERCRQAEAALRASEERFALAMRSASDGMWEWDLQNEEVVLSPRWKSMLGFADEELPSRLDAWRGRLHAEDRPRVAAALEAHLGGATPWYEQQVRLLHKDGRYRWLLSRGSALRHANGKAYRMVGLDTDITRVKRVETILDQMVEGTWGAHGEAFFRALVRHFAAALELPCAFVTECADRPPTRVRMLAFWSGDGFRDNAEYDLPGTPCADVIKEGRTCFYPSRLGHAFPREAEFESYLGIPIFSSEGQVIGHLAFLDTKEMREDVMVDSVFRIFAARAGAELERQWALARVGR